jgi:Flp pilus assembly protein TadG
MISLRRLNHLVTLKAFGKRFASDGRGVSAIEFALIAPVLILLYLGMAELTLGMMASRRVSHLTATIGDLVAQSDTLTPDNVTDLWKIAGSMLDPFSTSITVAGQPVSILRMRVASVTMQTVNNKTSAKVNWSMATNWTGFTNTSTEIQKITTGQIAVGESMIVTQAEYDYDSPIHSPLADFFKKNTKFTEIFYHHPRNGAAVTCTLCPVPAS